MTTLILASTKRYFGFGDKDDRVVHHGGRVIGTHIPVPTGARRPQLDVDDHCYGLSADDPQSRVFSDAYCETGENEGDESTTIENILSGQYSHPHSGGRLQHLRGVVA